MFESDTIISLPEIAITNHFPIVSSIPNSYENKEK